MKSDAVRLHAEIALARLRLRQPIVNRIRELAGGGLEPHEVAKHTNTPVDTVRLVLRAGSA